MAQSFTAKQTAYIQNYAALCQQLLTIADQLALANTEFTNDFFGSGGANALTDAVVQSVLPDSTAALFFSGEAAVVSALSAIATNRGTLEYMKLN